MGIGSMVSIDFYAAYVLVTTSAGRNRFTVRYDDFRVQDQDRFLEADDNEENGSAWTLAYVFQTGEKHRIALEYLRIASDRPVRAALNLPVHEVNSLFQTGFRIRF
jgi:hypothetical protein